jgi:hypothetical protein
MSFFKDPFSVRSGVLLPFQMLRLMLDQLIQSVSELANRAKVDQAEVDQAEVDQAEVDQPVAKQSALSSSILIFDDRELQRILLARAFGKQAQDLGFAKTEEEAMTGLEHGKYAGLVLGKSITADRSQILKDKAAVLGIKILSK